MIPYKYPSKNPLHKLKKTMVELNFDSKTIKSYLYYISEIVSFASKSPKNIQSKDIISYLEKLVKEKKSRSTLNTTHSALKFYFESILHRKFFAPHGKIGRAKLDKKQPVILTDKEVNKILKSTQNPKHRLIFELMYLTGLRISEIVNIKVKTLDFFKNQVKITNNGKHQKRTLGLPKNIVEKLKKYIGTPARSCYSVAGGQEQSYDDNVSRLPDTVLVAGETLSDNYLFKGQKNQKLTERAIQKAFLQVFKKTKIKKQATCHSLRHTFAVNLAKKGTKVSEIQQILGHKLPQTAQKYIQLAKNIKI
ncbi:tyrosine-type recombinase/integrase [Candidatus Falkowbacteria bacterium]|nr:tyrosine-type recombinase/integrase [Candidatus Falkowbacteria bacterium]MBT4432841.1 tyrosine-type recombinase/integrase [Candidatus Falkowbacteria bacterium]